MIIRLALYGALVVLLALVGYGLVLWALYACAPPPLPGDELWTLRQNATAAVGLIVRLGSAACFTASPTGALALWIGTRVAGVVMVVLALIVLWELAGRELRRALFRARGGHVLLAGAGDELLDLARAEGRFGATVFLAPDRPAATDLARSRPFTEIATLHRRSVSEALARLGARSARLVAAAMPADVTNVAIAETVLEHSGTGELLLRLEQPSVRALSAHRLSMQAEAMGRPLTVVSLTQLQTRRGVVAAMPGHYTLDGDPRIHIAFCGTGVGLEAAVLENARQGFGLERERPLFSVLRTGSRDFTAGALERLMDCAAVETRIATAFPGPGGLDNAAAGLLEDSPALRAIHCVSDDPAEAEAMALRWEELLLRFGRPVPPIVAYTSAGRTLGRTGMIRIAAAADLAEAHALARMREERARAVHQRFLDAQRAARGPAFGMAPAEVEWKDLPEFYREENRAVTDQMEDIKLARARMLARSGGAAAQLTSAEIEDLAQVAHARWLAVRGLQGWKHGTPRNDQLRLHPDLVPYEALSEAAKQKDRDEVASLVTMAGLAGLSLKREHPIGVVVPPDPAGLARLRVRLAAVPKTEIPVVVLPFDDESLLPLARTMLNENVALEVVLPAAPFGRPALSDVLRRALRIHVAIGRTAAVAVADRPVAATQSGGASHALA